MNESESNSSAAPAASVSKDASSPGETLRTKFIFSYGGFRKLFFGSLCGAFADRLYFSALIAAAYVIFFDKQPENYKGRIQIYATIPMLILYGFSGSFVDAYDRRKILTWVQALKIFIVLAFVPILWNVVQFKIDAPDFALRDTLAGMLPYWVALLVILNAITVPFSPARAAAIPDVVPEEHRSLGASLMATSGLLALLLAMAIGSQLARTDNIGPAWTIVVSSAFYAISTFLFMRLPDAVAVPGNKRGGEGSSASSERMTLGGHVQSFVDGIKYCLKRANVLGLIYFETVFWTVASAFYILFDFHARTAFGLQGNALSSFSGVALGLFAGVGLFTGALTVGKIANRASPIATYIPAYALLAFGLYGVFRAEAVNGGPPIWIYALTFGIGLGGGSMLGRVDADVLAVVDPALRGRVFSIKALAFAATNLVTIITISDHLTEGEKAELALWLPRALLLMFPLAIIFAWLVDMAIWAKRGDTQLPGPVHRAGYAFLRFSSRTIFKILFRYEVIGAENIPATGPVVLCANHASFIDPLLLGCSTQRLVQYIMYASYYRSFAHPVFRFLRCIPVDERGGTAALKAGMRSLKQGACVGIFPEGRVSADGNLQPPQGGVLFLAQRSGAPVVPVALKGNHAAFPRGAWFPRPKKITVIYGKPFTVGKDISREAMADITDKMMADLAEKLELPPPPKSEKPREKNIEPPMNADERR